MDEQATEKVNASWYNGFDVKTRMSVSAKQNRAYKNGTLPRPSKCLVCGNTEGIIMAHLEDYNKWQNYYPICFVCHCTLHGRYKRPGVFKDYLAWIVAGNKPVPFYKYDWRGYHIKYCSGSFALGKVGDPGSVELLSSLPMEYTDYVPILFRKNIKNNPIINNNTESLFSKGSAD